MSKKLTRSERQKKKKRQKKEENHSRLKPRRDYPFSLDDISGEKRLEEQAERRDCLIDCVLAIGFITILFIGTLHLLLKLIESWQK